jgi:hypothetical protein
MSSLNLPVPAEAPLWLRCQAKRGRQNHTKQILVSGQSSAGEGTQPSGYERLRIKKITNRYGGERKLSNSHLQKVNGCLILDNVVYLTCEVSVFGFVLFVGVVLILFDLLLPGNPLLLF